MNELIQKLVNKASKFGAQGYEVVGWIPPASASADPEGILVIQDRKDSINASSTPWYDK